MDSDNSNRSSDVLRNVVMGRVMEDGSWTEVGRFSDVNITFHGEEMPEEFTTKHLRPWNDVSFTAELLEPTIAQQIAEMAEQFAKIEEACSMAVWYICYANPDDHDAVEFIKSLYGTTPLRTLNDVIYTKLIEKGRLYLAPVSSIYGNLPSYLYGTQADITIPNEWLTEEPPVRDIPWLKKQLKHCKNPMERKQLERELNAAFKEKKRRRKK